MARNSEVYVPLSETNVSLNCERVSRRTMLGRGAMGLGGLLLGNQLGGSQLGVAAPKTRSKTKSKKEPEPAAAKPEAKAKAVIQIWLSGGPPHTDTFDPKPNAGSDYTGPLNKDMETNVKGIRICATLPELAKLADKYSIIRSMTHGKNGHETASYMVQTGRMPGGRLVYPAVGAVVAQLMLDMNCHIFPTWGAVSALDEAPRATLPRYVGQSSAETSGAVTWVGSPGAVCRR